MRAFVLLFSCMTFSIASAQESTRDHRMRTVEGFFQFYTYPKVVCADAGPDSLARVEAILTNIRKENLRAFELVEGTKEYFAVVTATRYLDNEEARAGRKRANAMSECARMIDQFPRMHEHHKKNKYFEYLVDLFSKPT